MAFSLNNTNNDQAAIDDLMEMLNAAQEDQEEVTNNPVGIAPRPVKDTGEDTGVVGYFRDWITKAQNKAIEARKGLEPEVDRVAKETARELSQAREMAGITQSSAGTVAPIEDNTQEEPDEIVVELSDILVSNYTPAGKDTEEAAPVTAETKKEGLMSPSKKKDETPTFTPPKFRSFETAEEMSDLEILARTIEAEAAGEPFQGKIAVGAVIANRAASGSYGSSGGIKGVILKPAQFSPWNDYTGSAGGKQGKDMLNLRPSADAYKAANAILTGNYVDPTNGATHYVNESVAEGQSWIDTMKNRSKGTVTIGNHLFGNADNNRVYDGKAWVASRSAETTGQSSVDRLPPVKTIQRIIGVTPDGDFGPNSRKKARSYLASIDVEVPKDATDRQLMDLVVSSPKVKESVVLPTGLTIAKATRNEIKPTSDSLNISLDFNSATGATGTEVIIPDNASPEVRAAAEKFNDLVVQFAAERGYTDYKNRGVKTRSENKRGVSNTIHVEPFFAQDSRMEALIKENSEEFAKLYLDAFGSLSATMVAPHGVPNAKGVIDRGAVSKTFGNELDFGNMILDILLANNRE